MARDGHTVAEAVSGPNVPEGRILIVAQASELIGLPNYSNVTVGPFAAYRLIDEGDDLHIKQEFSKLGEVVESVVSQQRQIVLDSVKAFAAAGGYNR
jgi:hypothetical protein